jgi:hypothetical protein
VDYPTQVIPIERVPVLPHLLYKRSEIDRAEVAHVIRQQRLLATGVGRLVLTEVRNGIVVVGLVDEEDARLPGFPGTMDDALPDGAGVKLAGDLLGLGMNQVVGAVRFDRSHERIGDSHRDVEVGDLGRVVLAGDELHDVGMVDPEDAHVGPASGTTLLDDIRGCVEQRHEGHGSRCHTHRRADDIVLWTEAGEAEPSAAARLVYQRHGTKRIVDAALPIRERIVDREHKACGQLAQRPSGVHQRG